MENTLYIWMMNGVMAWPNLEIEINLCGDAFTGSINQYKGLGENLKMIVNFSEETENELAGALWTVSTGILIYQFGLTFFIIVFILRFAAMPLILQDQSRVWSCLQVTQTSRKNAFLFLACSLR